MEQQLKSERERMEKEQAQHQATLQFQREMMQMMMQMQHTHQMAQPSQHLLHQLPQHMQQPDYFPSSFKTR